MKMILPLRSKLIVSSLVLMFLTGASFTCNAQTIIKRYACTDQSTSTFIYDYIKADKSDGYCDTGTKLEVVVNEGSNLVSSVPTVTRLDGGPHRAQINVAWSAGMTGVLKVDVFYYKRIYKGFPSTKCKWSGRRYLYSYEIHRELINPGGELKGTTTLFITNELTESTFSLTYKPTNSHYLDEKLCSQNSAVLKQSCGIKATKIKYGTGRDLNGDQSEDMVESNIVFDRGNYVGVPITYYKVGSGTVDFQPQVWVEINGGCGQWVTIEPAVPLTVKSNCHMSDFSQVTITLPNSEDVSHEDKQIFKVQKDVTYTFNVTGITDFNTHYLWNFADFGSDVIVNGNSFTPLEDGSYNITINAHYDDCPTPEPIDILVGIDNMNLTRDCSINLPADITDFYPEISSTDIVLEHLSAYVQSNNNIVVMPGVTLELGAELFIEFGQGTINTDHEINFTEKTAYDEYGNILLESRSYFNERGLPLQTQLKDFTKEVILATATLYDAVARPAISTLLAPVGEYSETCPDDAELSGLKDFTYKPDFVKFGDDPYDHTHFDLEKENGPDPVDGSEEGTLGWYYSASNGVIPNFAINEPQVAITQFPYSRTLYRDDGSGGVKGVTRPGDKFKAGSGYLATSTDEPVLATDIYFNSDYDSYLSIREKEFGFPRPVSIEGQFFKSVFLDESGKKSVTYSDKSGNTIISLYYGTGSTPITKSFNFYDNAGRMIVSISPNGLNQYTLNPTTNETNFQDIDKTFYFYNSKGWLSATEEKIAGQAADGISRTEYLYRKDGNIRFSQNEEQRNADPVRYSYTNYDRAGRPVESGEYEVSATGIAFNSSGMKDILESIAIDGGIPENSGLKKERTFTFYDQPDPNIPAGRAQGFVNGSVSYTRKENYITTWYSYDERGRVEWTVQDISGLGVKTIDYRYGPTGQVQDVAYQKGNPNEQFTHFYEYDADGRLSKTYTSREELSYDVSGLLTNANVTYNSKRQIDNPGVLEHQATYYYYLHGPLKRVELAKRNVDGNDVTLQGIDYVYTADGALKGINSADEYKDPGHDGSGVNASVKKDVFGMTLDYYVNDYVPAQESADAVTFTSPYPDQHTGLIKAMRWHGPVEPAKQFGYAYNYDQRNQFTKADWGVIAGTSFTATPSQPYHEFIGGYDANGNINSLKRNGNLLAATSAFDYDLRYNYKSNTNILESITHEGTSNSFRTYSYDDLGQMVRETEGDNSKFVNYDVTGKVTAVYADENHTQLVTEFKYDDRGFRLSKITYDTNHEPVLTTWYVRDATGNIISTYVTDLTTSGEPEAIEMPIYGSGRIGLYKPNFGVTFYELTDHLGNVRAVIGDELEAEYMATMETERNTEEIKDFENVDPTPTAEYINHTPEEVVVDNQPAFIIPNNNEVNRLNNRPLGTADPNPIGTGIMLLVHPGDVINAEVFVKYANFDAGNTNILASLASFLASSFTTAPVVDGVSLFNVVNTSEFATLPVWSGLDETEPRAFLNYLIFDKNFRLQAEGFDFDQVSSAAKIPATDPFAHSHEKLSLDVTIEKEGFIYVYVSNQSDQNMDVYFDDLKVKHKYSNIVAGGDFYPFGLSIKDREISREHYRFGYQGQFAEKDEETGWNHFELREYDPVIGRWTCTDPYRQYWSPYRGMGNDPVNYTDPDGGYSPFGAWWRNGFSMEGVYESGGEYGYNTIEDGGFVPHFGDERSWLPKSDILDQAFQNAGLSQQFETYDRIMLRGGDGIEFDALGQLSLGFLAADVLALTARGGVAVAANGGSSTIYRAVSTAEVDDIAHFGFRTKPGGYETGKLFAPTLQEATQFGKGNFMLDGIPNTIMKVRVPNSVLNGAHKFGADGMNAISIPANQLHLLRGTSLNYSPLFR
ncbi:MAG: RHS repeat-associated core domain-containing protein [Cyclobacteriaceae bacterium]